MRGRRRSMTESGRPRFRLVASLLAAIVLAGCGVPTDERPRDIASRRVPFELLAPSSTTSTTAAPVISTVVPVYMVVNEKVVPLPREVLAPAVLTRLLAALLKGPTVEESDSGLRTAIPNDTRLLSARLDGSIATIDLSGELLAVSGQEQILALAQIVFTATELPGVAGVRFALDDKPIEVPRADGTLTSDPLRRSDYESLRQPTE